MKDKLQEYALIAEIIGGIAIVVSLVFVGLQIQEGNKESRSSTMQASLDSELTFQTQIALYAAIWDKVDKGEELSPGEEERRGIILYNMLMTNNENRYYQLKSGYLENDPAVLSSKIVKVPMYKIWRQSGGALSRTPDFLELVDNLHNDE